MPREEYILYVLKVSKVSSVKIGLTSLDRFKKRIYEIEKTFGKIDKENSLYYKSESFKDIKNLEKALHLIFWRDSKELKKRANGSGHTEFFKQSKLRNIVKLIDLIKKDMSKIKGPFKINASNKLKKIFYLALFTAIGILIYVIGK